MNIEKVHVIEGLARAACHLSRTETASRLMGVIDQMIEPEGSAEEIQALEASNMIKQANINLLADSIHALAVSLEFTSVEAKSAVLLNELTELARSLKQEEPETQAAVVN